MMEELRSYKLHGTAQKKEGKGRGNHKKVQLSLSKYKKEEKVFRWEMSKRDEN